MRDDTLNELHFSKYSVTMSNKEHDIASNNHSEAAGQTQHLHEKLQLALGSVRRSVDSYVTEGGVYFILWGLLIPVATALSYVLGAAGMGWAVAVVWVITWLSGGAGSAFLSRRRNPDGVGALAGKLYNGLWISLGSGLLVLVAATVLPMIGTALDLTEVTGLGLKDALFGIGLLMGLAFMVSGAFSSLRWMRPLALLWWVAGLVALFVPLIWAPAVIATATAVLNLIPGIILSKRYRSRRDAAVAQPA